MNKEKIIEMLQQGYSINKTSQELHIPKSTVYYIYRKIGYRKYKPLEFIPNNSENEGEIVGIFAGDGSQIFYKKNYSYEVRVYFGIKNKEYALYVKELYEHFFGKKFELQTIPNHQIRIKTKSKQIYLYFHHYLSFIPKIKHETVKLKTLNYPNGFKIGFLRGIFDTDGSVRYNRHDKYVKIILRMTSSEIIYQVKQLLEELDIKCGKYTIKNPPGEKTIYSVQVWKKDVNRFLNLINPYKKRLLGSWSNGMTSPSQDNPKEVEVPGSNS